MWRMYLFFKKEVKNENVEIDAHEMVQYLSFTYDINFISIGAKLTQEKILTNISYDSPKRCCLIQEIEE